MFREIVELIWVASLFSFGWSVGVMVLIGLPSLIISKYTKSSEVQTQLSSMRHFVLWWTGIFAYFGLLGMFYSYLAVALAS